MSKCLTYMFFCAISAYAQAGSGLSGELRSIQGQAAVKGKVRIVRKAPGEIKGFPVPHMGVLARSSGATASQFDFPTVSTGDALICVQPEDFEHLDPCKWGEPRVISVSANSKQALGAITLKKGIPLRVLIEDPNQLMGDDTAVRLGLNVQVGFHYPGGVFEPMRLESASVQPPGFVYQYAVAIPYGVDLRVGLISHKLVLTTDKGGAVTRGGASFGVRAEQADREKTFRFRVTARVAGGTK